MRGLVLVLNPTPWTWAFRSFRVDFRYTHIETNVNWISGEPTRPLVISRKFLVAVIISFCDEKSTGPAGTGPVDLVTGLTVGIFGRRDPHIRRDRRAPLRMRQVVARSVLGPVHGVQVARHLRCAHVVIQAVSRRSADSAVKHGPSEPRHRRRSGSRGRSRGHGRRALKPESLYSSKNNVWRRFQTRR